MELNDRIRRIRADFPILNQPVHGRPLVYLDNGATTQLPLPVLETLEEHFRQYNSNVHRGVHALSQQSTAHMEAARDTVRQFLNAASPAEIVFTSGTTHSVNLVAGGLRSRLGPGDEIITTEMEHHSNLLPWQALCRATGAALKVVPLTAEGELDMAAYAALLSPRVKLAAVTAVSNVLGTINPLPEFIAAAHAVGARVLVDGAQGLRHGPVDVRALDCDYFCFSGHKLFAPAGIGVLYGKAEALDELEPVFTGGGMVADADCFHACYEGLPQRLEAGTPNYPGAIALGAAIRYIQEIGLDAIARREAQLTALCEETLAAFPAVRILGAPARRAGAVSFSVDGVQAYDLAVLLDQLGVAVRSGHHCALPVLKHYGLSYALRVSPAFYNTEEEIQALGAAMARSLPVLGVKL